MGFSKRLVLASRSPRRLHLLTQIGLEPEVIPSDIDEVFDTSASAEENATRLALEKARDVSRHVDDGVIIGADTIVVLDGEFLGKPTGPRDAVGMLARLSGKSHSVVTGFAIVDRPSNRFVCDSEQTKVFFRVLPPDEIRDYVAGGSPLDKAGSYGIQDDYGAVFVSRIEGCFYNVVGFPLSRFQTTLREFPHLSTE